MWKGDLMTLRSLALLACLTLLVFAAAADTPSPAASSRPAETSSSQSASSAADGEIPLPPPPPIVKYAGPTYCVIPMHGTVGEDIVSTVVDNAFKDILKRKPTAIILEMDSPGGLVREMAPLINAIHKYRDFRLVVFVKQAISAAAITTISVKEIYMAPGSVIGAATVFDMNEKEGTIKDSVAKTRTYVRELAEIAAENGGHQILLAKAMVEANYSLVWKKENGKKVIREGYETGNDERFLKRGKLLCITAGEAVDAGLANGTAEDYKALGTAMGFPKWQECKCYAPILMDNWSKNFQQAKKGFDRLEDECKKDMKQAEATDPSQFSYVLRNGFFTSDSQQKWQTRSIACLKFLAQASDTLDKMADLAEKYPELLPDPRLIREERDRIDAIKMRMQARADKEGHGD